MKAVARTLMLVLAGVVAGWILGSGSWRSLRSGSEVPVPNSVQSPGPDASAVDGLISTPPAEEFLAPTPKAETPQLMAQTGITDSDQLRAGTLESSVADAFKAGDLVLAATLCPGAGAELRHGCAQALADAVKSRSIPLKVSLAVVDAWLEESPEEMVVGLAGVTRLVIEGLAVEAVDLLVRLQGFQESADGKTRIADKARELIGPAVIRLTLQQDQDGVARLLQRLLVLEPDNLEWRLKLAIVQVDTGDYASASENLAYMMFDVEFGDEARELSAEISERLRLANYSEIPLERVANQFVVSAVINGRVAVPLLLDTGASITVLDKEVLDQAFARDGGRSVSLVTAAGRIESRINILDRFAVGERELLRFEVARLSLGQSGSRIRGGLGARASGPSSASPWASARGLLGMNFLDQFHFVINQEKGRLFLKKR